MPSPGAQGERENAALGASDDGPLQDTMPHLAERRGAPRYTWTDKGRSLARESRPLRLRAASLGDIRDISATGILVGVLGPPPPSAALEIDVPSSTADASIEASTATGRATTRRLSVELKLSAAREQGCAYEIATENRTIVDATLHRLEEEGVLAPAGSRGPSSSTSEADASSAAPFRLLDACFEASVCPHHPHLCADCGKELPDVYQPHCPTCRKERPFPNVAQACSPIERRALNKLYASHTAHLTPEQTQSARVLIHASFAVLALKPEKLLSAFWGTSKPSNYHADVESGHRMPDGPAWGYHRHVVDEAIFPGYKENIVFAALSLDGRGVSRFGSCFVKLKEDVVSRRASLFAENSFFAVREHSLSKLPEAVRGKRAAWPHRDYLALAKHAGALPARVTQDVLAPLILCDGADPRDPTTDTFIEVHLFGTLDPECFEVVSVAKESRFNDEIATECLRRKIPFEMRQS